MKYKENIKAAKYLNRITERITKINQSDLHKTKIQRSRQLSLIRRDIQLLRNILDVALFQDHKATSKEPNEGVFYK